MSQELTQSQLETLQKITTMIEADFGQKEALEVLLVLSPKARDIVHQKKIEKFLLAAKEVFAHSQMQRPSVVLLKTQSLH